MNVSLGFIPLWPRLIGMGLKLSKHLSSDGEGTSGGSGKCLPKSLAKSIHEMLSSRFGFQNIGVTSMTTVSHRHLGVY